MKKNLAILIEVSAFLLAMALMIYLIFVIKTESAECTLDPLVYGVKKLQESNKYEISCSCSLLSENPSQTLVFNAEGKNYVNPVITGESYKGYTGEDVENILQGLNNSG